MVTRNLLALLTFPGGGKQIHDTNIVATMLAYGITEITDPQREGLHSLLPSNHSGASLEQALRHIAKIISILQEEKWAK